MPATPKPKKPKKERPVHHAADFDLDVGSGDSDMFKWFLLVYLFGKPIQSDIAVHTWRLLIKHGLDTPWSIAAEKERQLVHVLYLGKYTHYADSTARGLQICMNQLLRDYDGSLMLMCESSPDEDEFSKRLQQLHGVGPKTAEIFMRETAELLPNELNDTFACVPPRRLAY